jgi:hypothetical protein
MSNIPAPGEVAFLLLERQVVGLRRRSVVRFRCALGTLGWLSFSERRDRREMWVANPSKAAMGRITGQALALGTPVVIRLRGPNPGAPPDHPPRLLLRRLGRRPGPCGVGSVSGAYTSAGR